MKKYKLIVLLSLALFVLSCTLKPTLSPINVNQVDIGKDGKIYFELIDSHRRVVVKNRSNLPGIHHDVDENNYLPQPFVQYIDKNILNNLSKSPGLNILTTKDDADFLITFNLQHFDVFRETSGGAAAAGILIGGLLGAAIMNEKCTAQMKGVVTVSDPNSGDVLCSFETDVNEVVEFNMNDLKKGYTNATQRASSEIVKQIINGLTNC